MRYQGRTATLAYYTQGEGPTILFVHGNGSTHKIWNATIQPLESSFQCISYDLRGHGASHKYYEAFTLDLLINDLEELRSHLELDRFYLVGHSLGALVAAEYAYRFPERIEKLCMIAAPAARNDSARSAGESLLAQLKEQGVKETMSGLVRRWYTDSFVTTHPGALEARLEQLTSISEQVFINAYALYTHTDIDARLPDLSMPTLVMTGEYASGCDAEVARCISETIPNSHLVIFREMKNGVLTEIPERVSKEILNYFLE
ncbi:alpha/beta fold hydrolase [Fodinicurvata sediminis]|uniref:alpha/beta fold hydrolase n=1 Tax=Fodinicurvata sediminis TaxID=1121832 RepID=UPI0009DBE5E3|nr:alpha/beta hydrolase [Fodinicurvata sediminis]